MRILGLFGPPNIEKLRDKGDAEGLIKALAYKGKESQQINEAASDALVDMGEPEPLVALLSQPDDALRSSAKSILARIGAPAIDSVSIALKDANWEVRRAAVESLGGIAHNRSVEALIKSLTDRHARVRESAAEALRHNSAATSGSIASALEGADDQTRERLVTILGDIGDEQAVGPLIASFKDESINVRNAAGQSLKQLGEIATDPLLSSLTDADEEVRRNAATTLGDIGDARAIGPLINALSDKDWSVRRTSAEALGKIGDPQAVEPLIKSLTTDADEDVKSGVASALGELRDERAITPLIDSLKQDSWTLRRSAIEALESIGAAAIDSLIAVLGDMHESVREAATEILGDLGDAAVNPLITALRDENASEREAAAIELGGMREAQAVEPLIAALEDTDDKVRLAAARALGQIGDDRAAEPLAALLGDTNQDISNRALDALVKIGAPAVPALLAALESPEAVRQEQAVSALGQIKDTRAVRPMFALLKSEDETVRMAVAHALGSFGGPVLNSLIAALEGDDDKLREASAIALGDVGDERAVKPLTDALRSKDRSVQLASAQALGKIGGSGIESLLSELKNVFWDVRLASATALGETGDERAVQPLQALLNDPERAVRAAAEKSLAQLGSKQNESP